MPMKIICNGKEKETRPGISLNDFIIDLGLRPENVVAECNGTIVKREEYNTYLLKDDSMLELIRFVGGG